MESAGITNILLFLCSPTMDQGRHNFSRESAVWGNSGGPAASRSWPGVGRVVGRVSLGVDNRARRDSEGLGETEVVEVREAM